MAEEIAAGNVSVSVSRSSTRAYSSGNGNYRTDFAQEAAVPLSTAVFSLGRATLEVAEKHVAHSWPFLVPLMAGKAWLIMDYFMHIRDLGGSER